jgi:hypothetical protein
MWGQWLYRDGTSGKFNLNYAGKPSLFEGEASPPGNFDRVKLQILAVDQAGNFGQHILSYRVNP